MFIDEAVITCVDYADFLRVTLPHNLLQIRRIVVVTSDRPGDDETRKVCREFGVKCISTGLFHAGGARFAKGRGVNKGMDQLSKQGWTLHMDADIVLPPKTSFFLSRMALDKKCIYGVDRVLVPNALAWKRHLSTGIPQHRWNAVVETPGEFPFMARYVHETEGYCPIGFFQLFHGDSKRDSHDLRYPEDGNEAIHTDVQFALHWDRSHRHLIPEIIAYHLDSNASPVGANWSGRTTPRFDLNDTTVPSKAGVKSYYDPAFRNEQNPNTKGYA
jgi:hypothetical protein